MSSLFFLFLTLFICNVDAANYSVLKKYLTAKMYGEAYMEILRNEIASDKEDKKLLKLKKDLLKRTKRQLLKRAKLNPDDPNVFTILADISFQQDRLDEAVKFISPQINSKPGPLSHYVFAKILFRKGNLEQSFDQMSLSLEANPDSTVIFDAFQFLYSCKSYGISTAKKICKRKSFLRVAVPISSVNGETSIPNSPYENDPTKTAVAVNPVNTDDTKHAKDIAMLDAAIKDDNKPPVVNKPTVDRPKPMPITQTDDVKPAVDLDTSLEEKPLISDTDTEPKKPEEDPEQKKIKNGEYWFMQAQKQYKSGQYDDAEKALQKAVSEYSNIEGKEELAKKIAAKQKIFADYEAEAKVMRIKSKKPGDYTYTDSEIVPILTAWKEDPKRVPDAPEFLATIYLSKDNPDEIEALKYIDIIINKNADDPYTLHFKWIKMQILTKLHRWKEANDIFNNLASKEEKFVKQQSDYRQKYYLIWYNLYKIPILIGVCIFILAFLTVFFLMLLPAISGALFDPGKGAKREFKKENYEKAAMLAEKALRKSPPIQIERGLLEIHLQSHFYLKNYVRCQESAKALLEKFPENNIAWGFLAKASIASQDMSDEAIAMYENLYRENPDNSEYLPLLAKYYADKGITSVEAMNTMYAYYQIAPDNQNVVVALAHCYVKSKTMGDQVIEILKKALETKNEISFRELLARNYSRAGNHLEAARECINVLENNINNMGIHVVYTSSMKKAGMLEEAIARYEQFLKLNPNNPQLIEILGGLKRDYESSAGEMPNEFPEELAMPEITETDLPMPGLGDVDFPEPQMPSGMDIDGNIDDFVEPPPEGFKDELNVPVPDFLKQNGDIPEPVVQSSFNQPPSAATNPSVSLPTLDPFADNPSLPEDIQTELPEELGGKPKFENIVNESMIPELNIPAPAKKETTKSSSGQLSLAKSKAKLGKWQEVIETLSPVFASEREKEAGILLADAHLQNKNAVMAREIIDTLDFDPELMDDETKDILYRVGLALEAAGELKDALRMYDTICNVDINYKEAFDRSDKLYNKVN